MTLTPLDLVLTLGFLGLTIAISAALGLGLTRQWLTAGGRTLLQLAGLGYLLAIASGSPHNSGQSLGWALAVTAAVLALGIFNIQKQVQGLPRWVYGAIAGGLGGAVLVSTSLIVIVMLRSIPWDLPLVWFAIAAAIATPASHGTAQTALLLHRQLTRLQYQSPNPRPPTQPSQTPQDVPLSGADDWTDGWDWEDTAGENSTIAGVSSPHAASPRRTLGDRKRDAIRQGITPTLNGLMAAGITTIPLFLSGQLLGQVPPLTAVSLQITILFAAAFTTLIGSATAAHSVAIAHKPLVEPEIIR